MDGEQKKAIERAVRALKRAGAREVYLFGSVTKGRTRPQLPIDLAPARNQSGQLL